MDRLLRIADPLATARTIVMRIATISRLVDAQTNGMLNLMSSLTNAIPRCMTVLFPTPDNL